MRTGAKPTSALARARSARQMIFDSVAGGTPNTMHRVEYSRSVEEHQEPGDEIEACEGARLDGSVAECRRKVWIGQAVFQRHNCMDNTTFM